MLIAERAVTLCAALTVHFAAQSTAFAQTSALTSPPVIREVQQRLWDQNAPMPADRKRITGNLDATTRDALRQWQSARGLPETGDLAARDLAVLRAAPVPRRWAAIGIQGDNVWAYSVGRRSRDEAITEAQSRCAAAGTSGRTARCTVHTAQGDQCLALAYYRLSRRDRRAEGVAVSGPRPTTDAARADALDACRGSANAPGSCTIRVIACGSGGQTN